MEKKDRISPLLLAGTIIAFTGIFLVANLFLRSSQAKQQTDEKMLTALVGTELLLQNSTVPSPASPSGEAAAPEEISMLLLALKDRLGFTNIFVSSLVQGSWISLSSSPLLSHLPDYLFHYQAAWQKAIAHPGEPVWLDLTYQGTHLHSVFSAFSLAHYPGTVIIGIQSSDADFTQPRHILLYSILLSLVFLFFALLLYFIYYTFFRQRQSTMLKEVFSDQLTLLPNRNQLLNDLKRSNHPLLIILNIQSFKNINNFYGSDMGDFILLSLSAHLQAVMKEVEHRLYRIQADEFAILIDREFFRSDLSRMLEYLSNAINEKTFRFQDHEINISTYMGVAQPEKEDRENHPADLWQKIITQADTALKQCRDQHSSYMIYERSMNLEIAIAANIKWTKIVRDAIRHDRIVPYFQPIYNNHTRRVEKYECLARLIDDKGTVIAPYHFLEIAKETQLYHKITCSIIRKCFDIFRATQLDFSINLSVKDILHKETRDFIIHILNSNPSVSRHLVFEIVESEGIEHLEIVTDFIYTIKKYGTRIAIDDFGSGYSNFANILKLKIDFIKIDASLIKNIDFDGNSQIITRSIIWFARELGLETISEYVHSQDVFEKALELGVDYSQGYFIGEPQPSIDAGV